MISNLLLGALLLFLLSPTQSFITATSTTTKDVARSCPRSFPLSQSQNIEVDENGDDDDGVLPYQNRTLAWTKRYRKLIPYDFARFTAMRLGLKTKEDWDEIRQFGKAFQGAHSVSRPDLMYAKEWVSWEEFLGTMREYEDTKEIIKSLGIKSMKGYIEYVKGDVKRAERLRIPAKPEIYYRDKGWEGGEAFFDGQ